MPSVMTVSQVNTALSTGAMSIGQAQALFNAGGVIDDAAALGYGAVTDFGGPALTEAEKATYQSIVNSSELASLRGAPLGNGFGAPGALVEDVIGATRMGNNIERQGKDDSPSDPMLNIQTNAWLHTMMLRNAGGNIGLKEFLEKRRALSEGLKSSDAWKTMKWGEKRAAMKPINAQARQFAWTEFSNQFKGKGRLWEIDAFAKSKGLSVYQLNKLSEDPKAWKAAGLSKAEFAKFGQRAANVDEIIGAAAIRPTVIGEQGSKLGGWFSRKFGMKTAEAGAKEGAEVGAKAGLKAAGAGLAKGLGKCVPGLSVAMAGMDWYECGKIWKDPNASWGKKIAGGVTAVASSVAAACSFVPGLGTAAAAVASGVSVVTGFLRDLL